jgi:hypothetical protein
MTYLCQGARWTGTIAGIPSVRKLRKSQRNNRLEAGVQLRPGAPDPSDHPVSSKLSMLANA